MGLLSSIGKVATNALKSFETIVQAPIKSIQTIGNQAAFNELSNKINSDPLGKQIGRILVNTGTVAAAVVGGGAALGSKTATTIVKAAAPIIPSTTKGKVIAAVAAPVVIGAVTSQPAKTISAVAKTPSSLANVGSNVANLIAEPSKENLKELVTENPVIVGGAAALGAVVAGKTILPAVGGIATREAIKEQTEVLKEVGGINVIDKSAGFVPSVPTTQQAIAAPAPVTPQTNIAKSSSTGKVRRRKRKSARSLPSINQRVNVVVQQNKSSRTTKNYINREVLLN